MQLLDRFGRRIKLTDAGDVFYDRAAVDSRRDRRRQDLCPNQSRLAKGRDHRSARFTPSRRTCCPKWSAGLTKQFPQAQVTVEERLTEELIANCLAGELDVGIVALPIAEQRVRAESLFTEKLVAALPADSSARQA